MLSVVVGRWQKFYKKYFGEGRCRTLHNYIGQKIIDKLDRGCGRTHTLLHLTANSAMRKNFNLCQVIGRRM
jgi:hypothetical protein